MRKKWTYWGCGAAIFAIGFALERLANAEYSVLWWIGTALLMASYLFVGWKVLWKAARNILHGQIFDENFLMTIASVGAICIGEVEEAAAVMLFYQLGELFEDMAVRKSRGSLKELMALCPDVAHVMEDGSVTDYYPDKVPVDSVILVQPGEKIPLDGVVMTGSSSVNTAALTGESMPQPVDVGAEVMSGSVNESGALTIRVTKPYGDSTVAKILELVENASSSKAAPERFISKFAAVYTPVVVIGAVVLAILPPVLGFGAFTDWLYRALNFLVVSCPCALVISVPLSYFCSIGAASRKGVLVKGGVYMERLANVSTAVFDKTGTLTEGRFTVRSLHPTTGVTEETLLTIAARTEALSNHPIAQSIRAAYTAKIGALPTEVPETTETAGHGIAAVLDGKTAVAGNEKSMTAAGLPAPVPAETAYTAVHVAYDGRYLGWIELADRPKENAAEAIRALKTEGVTKTVMLTGDRQTVGDAVGKEIGLDAVHGGLLPDDKVRAFQKLREASAGNTMYTGDGINDAPVLAMADIGVAMGGIGSDAAMEAADMVILTDDLSRLPDVIRLAKKTMRLVKENITFALLVKAVILVLSAIGCGNLWLAVFADVGVSVLCIMNALRAK